MVPWSNQTTDRRPSDKKNLPLGQIYSGFFEKYTSEILCAPAEPAALARHAPLLKHQRIPAIGTTWHVSIVSQCFLNACLGGGHGRFGNLGLDRGWSNGFGLDDWPAADMILPYLRNGVWK